MKSLEKTLKTLNRTVAELETIKKGKEAEENRIEAQIRALQSRQAVVHGEVEKASRVGEKIKDLIS